MKKWTRRSADRPIELARAALELCAERGVQATRVADVAERAGVTVGTVYRYYRDKDALIDAALQLPPRPAPRSEATTRPGGALPRLSDSIRRWAAFFRDDASRSVRVALSDPTRDPARTPSALGDAVSELTRVIDDGAQRGELRNDLNAETLARALVSAIAAHSVIFSATAAAPDAETEALVAIAMRGLRADGPSWKA